jgi:hypothetical protein
LPHETLLAGHELSGRFREFAVIAMVCSGILMLWQQRAWLLGSFVGLGEKVPA